jgi:hypothetical protein
MKGGESIMRKRIYIKPIGIMVSEEMHACINQICNERELAISDYVRSAIELKLSQETIDEKQSKEN